ncbi:hypothetical protein SETIT_2G210500v2 [Setaria italica]|uniref:Uncharacterized protein n=1 Tax=Setaria italica TaxID=4555 RepID=A0A368Q1E9_SETIT|nr:hypothetical protein SETIT_2G210500v2 [Setaria italica]
MAYVLDRLYKQPSGAGGRCRGMQLERTPARAGCPGPTERGAAACVRAPLQLQQVRIESIGHARVLKPALALARLPWRLADLTEPPRREACRRRPGRTNRIASRPRDHARAISMRIRGRAEPSAGKRASPLTGDAAHERVHLAPAARALQRRTHDAISAAIAHAACPPHDGPTPPVLARAPLSYSSHALCRAERNCPAPGPSARPCELASTCGVRDSLATIEELPSLFFFLLVLSSSLFLPRTHSTALSHPAVAGLPPPPAARSARHTTPPFLTTAVTRPRHRHCPPVILHHPTGGTITAQLAHNPPPPLGPSSKATGHANPQTQKPKSITLIPLHPAAHGDSPPSAPPTSRRGQLHPALLSLVGTACVWRRRWRNWNGWARGSNPSMTRVHSLQPCSGVCTQ